MVSGGEQFLEWQAEGNYCLFHSTHCIDRKPIEKATSWYINVHTEVDNYVKAFFFFTVCKCYAFPPISNDYL